VETKKTPEIPETTDDTKLRAMETHSVTQQSFAPRSGAPA